MLLRLSLFGLTIFSAFLLPTLPRVLQWDTAAVAALAAWRSPEWTIFFHFFTDIADTGGFLVMLAVPTLIFLFARRWLTALCYVIGVDLLKVSVSWLKVFVARPRPPGALHETSYSMPSGHGANAIFIFGVAALIAASRISSRNLRIFIFIICFVAIVATDLSRVYLGVHYPSDVLIGSLYAMTGLWVLQGFRKDILKF